MKNVNSFFIAALFISMVMLLNSCTAIEGIFKAGVWTGIIIVVVIIAIIIWIITRVTKK
jgi:hypothetical protein